MDEQERSFVRVQKAINRIKSGQMVIMVDDEDRENEGDLVFAGDFVNAELINFMAKEARGLICLTLDPPLVDRLKLPMMGDDSLRSEGRPTTAFTVSIEARRGVTTGISASDRAETIRVALAAATTPDDIVVPGHVFPLKAKPGGVLERAGHTEGSVDLARMAGLSSAGVICEIMRDDGKMARMPDLINFSKKHDIPIVTIADLITYRLMRDSLVERLDEQSIATPDGIYRGIVFKNHHDQSEHFALVKGQDFENCVVEVRVQVQRPLVDLFDHGVGGGRQRMQFGLDLLAKSENAVVVYLAQPEPAEPLTNQLRAIADNNQNPNNSQRSWGSSNDIRHVGIGAQILRNLGVNRANIHMTNPRPIKGLGGFGLEVEAIKAIAFDDWREKAFAQNRKAPPMEKA